MSVIYLSCSIFFKNYAFSLYRASSYAFSVLATSSSIFFSRYLLLYSSWRYSYCYLCCLARIYYRSSFFSLSFKSSMVSAYLDYGQAFSGWACGSSFVTVFLNCYSSSFILYSSFALFSSSSFSYASFRWFSSSIRLFFWIICQYSPSIFLFSSQSSYSDYLSIFSRSPRSTSSAFSTSISLWQCLVAASSFSSMIFLNSFSFSLFCQSSLSISLYLDFSLLICRSISFILCSSQRICFSYSLRFFMVSAQSSFRFFFSSFFRAYSLSLSYSSLWAMNFSSSEVILSFRILDQIYLIFLLRSYSFVWILGGYVFFRLTARYPQSDLIFCYSSVMTIDFNWSSFSAYSLLAYLSCKISSLLLDFNDFFYNYWLSLDISLLLAALRLSMVAVTFELSILDYISRISVMNEEARGLYLGIAWLSYTLMAERELFLSFFESFFPLQMFIMVRFFMRLLRLRICDFGSAYLLRMELYRLAYGLMIAYFSFYCLGSF